MKKLIAIFSLATALSANAFFNNNDGPWGNNGPWGGGWNDDNGIFGYNSYDYWDPRWYFEEFENMMDEFDDNGWGDNYYGGGYGPYGGGPWGGNNGPWNNGPWGGSNGPWGGSNSPWGNGPWSGNAGPWGPAARVAPRTPVAPAAPTPAK